MSGENNWFIVSKENASCNKFFGSVKEENKLFYNENGLPFMPVWICIKVLFHKMIVFFVARFTLNLKQVGVPNSVELLSSNCGKGPLHLIIGVIIKIIFANEVNFYKATITDTNSFTKAAELLSKVKVLHVSE